MFSIFLFLSIAFAEPTDVSIRSVETNFSAVNKTVLLKLVNAARKKGCNCGNTYYPPAQPVTWNDKLQQAAQNHSNDMDKNNYFNHKDRKGYTAAKRITEAGYQWWGYGENIANGYTSEETVIKGWLSSPGHCSNIMNKSYKEMGVGRAGGYWTQVMATGK